MAGVAKLGSVFKFSTTLSTALLYFHQATWPLFWMLFEITSDILDSMMRHAKYSQEMPFINQTG